MKTFTKQCLLVLALLALAAGSAAAQVSLRGLYVPSPQTNPQLVIWVHDNDTIGIHVFDSTAGAVSFGKARIANDTFSVTTNTGQKITGTLSGLAPDTRPSIAGSFTPAGDGATATAFTAPRVPVFLHTGNAGTNPLVGRYDGNAADQNSPGAVAITFIIDANNNLYVFGADKSGKLFGGLGTVTEQDQTGTDPSDEGSNDPITVPGGTIALTLADGTAVTGSFTVSRFVMAGTLQTPTSTIKFSAHSDAGAYHLANISTRAFVSTGQGALIGGFIIQGGPKQVLIRAIGPGLASKGVSPVLAAPKLDIYKDATLIASNTGWKNNANAADIIATTLVPTADGDSALLTTLQPGGYTCVVTGSDGGTGIALVEGYEVGLQ